MTSDHARADVNHQFDIGDEVIDKDKEGSPKLVIVKRPDAVSKEWVVKGTGQTIADFNPDYDEDALIVSAAFKDKLADKVPDWDSLTPRELSEKVEDVSLSTYTYPEPRLRSSIATLPDDVDTFFDLIAYQWARLVAVAADLENDDAGFIRHTYNEIIDGEITISSLEKENKYQLKEGMGECIYCGKESETEFDHVIPINNGGARTVSNQVPACPDCNRSKSDTNVLEWCKEEHDGELPRIAFGKYLKLRKKQWENEDKLHEPLSEEVRNRWNGIKIVRNISKPIYMNDR